jgi:hypothetical protein
MAGRLSTVDLLIKAACFVEKASVIVASKAGAYQSGALSYKELLLGVSSCLTRSCIRLAMSSHYSLFGFFSVTKKNYKIFSLIIW